MVLSNFWLEDQIPSFCNIFALMHVPTGAGGACARLSLYVCYLVLRLLICQFGISAYRLACARSEYFDVVRLKCRSGHRSNSTVGRIHNLAGMLMPRPCSVSWARSRIPNLDSILCTILVQWDFALLYRLTILIFQSIRIARSSFEIHLCVGCSRRNERSIYVLATLLVFQFCFLPNLDVVNARCSYD